MNKKIDDLETEVNKLVNEVFNCNTTRQEQINNKLCDILD